MIQAGSRELGTAENLGHLDLLPLGHDAGHDLGRGDRRGAFDHLLGDAGLLLAQHPHTTPRCGAIDRGRAVQLVNAAPLLKRAGGGGGEDQSREQ